MVVGWNYGHNVPRQVLECIALGKLDVVRDRHNVYGSFRGEGAPLAAPCSTIKNASFPKKSPII